MDRQLLEQAAQKALEKFFAQSPEERRAKMTSGEYAGLFDVISNMTLSDDDIEELTQADKYLGPAGSEEDEKIPVMPRPVLWDAFTQAGQVLAEIVVPDTSYHFRKDRGEGRDTLSFSVETKNSTFAIESKTIDIHHINSATLLNNDGVEGAWQLNAQAA